MPEARAERVQQQNGRWQVIAVSGGRPITIDADNVFVCGGAVETPALLRRSRIQGNIGNSLALHPTVQVVAIFDEEINDEHSEVPAQQVKEF